MGYFTETLNSIMEGNAVEENLQDILTLRRKKKKILKNPKDARKTEDASNGILFINKK